MIATRRLAAVLAADVAGYSRLMGADEEGTLAAFKAVRRELGDPKIAEHNGRIVKTTGDGLLVEFQSVVDAARCAVEVQRAMGERNTGVPADKRIEFRIGINLGDVILDDGDIFGDGVNVAARLEALAEPGGICISGAAHEQIRDKLDLAFEDLGEQQVKNIARPVRIYKVILGGAASTLPAPRTTLPELPRRGVRAPRPVITATALTVAIGLSIVAWWTWSRVSSTALVETPAVARLHTSSGGADVNGTPAPAAPLLSFVVLPFANLSNDPEQDYFADAITEDLTTDLSRIDGSFVIARSTAFAYKAKSVDVKQIGRDLGVRYVLDGSVRRLGDQVQVNVQLIDAESGAHLWADRFDTDLRDVAQAQSEITGRLARTLNLQLIAAAGQRLEAEKKIDPDARDLVMLGRALLLRPVSIENRQQSLQAFERALAIDPGSVDARIGMAHVLVGNVLEGWATSAQQDEARAKQLLTEALGRNAGSAWAHYVMGMLHRTQNELPQAKIESEQAIALDRNYASAITQLAIILNHLGQPGAAIPLQEKAIRLDPQGPFLDSYYWNLGLSHLLLGQVDEAANFARRARAANPGSFMPTFLLAAALGLKGDVSEARVSLAEAIRIKPTWDTHAHFLADCTPCLFGDPQYRALLEKTVFPGLRRAGLPDE